ncbi:unnamed protein product, partial [Larinioides sclopetarius]
MTEEQTDLHFQELSILCKVRIQRVMGSSAFKKETQTIPFQHRKVDNGRWREEEKT